MQEDNSDKLDCNINYVNCVNSITEKNLNHADANKIGLSINLDIWTLFFDGSKSQEGDRASCLLINPKGENSFLYCILELDYTNNTAQYEALVQGLKKVIDSKIEKIKVFGDFKS